MLDETLLPERIFGLTVVDGHRSVRPGAVVRFRFRARNAGDIASPAARLSLTLPFGWSSLDPLAVEIPAVRPGGEHVVWFAARPDLADESTAVSRFQAVLAVDDMVLGSNVVRVGVTGSARFGAPASGVRIEPGAGVALRVVVDVVNEGDAAARGVRISVPPPLGFRADPAVTVATVAELQPGAAFAFAYEMEPVAPTASNVRIDDAFVAFEGGRAALTTAAPYALTPQLLAPEITSARTATRLSTTIRIANDGWVAARDTRIEIALPAGWRLLRGTILVDGAPAAIRRDAGTDNGVVVTLPFVPARGAVALSVVSSAARARGDGTIAVSCGPLAVTAAIPEPTVRALRLEARPALPSAVPGAPIAVTIDAFNHGETREALTVTLGDCAVWRGELNAGAAVSLTAQHVVSDGCADGDVVSVPVGVVADDGTALAATTIALRALDRPWIAIEDVRFDRGDARVNVRNVGATTARDLFLESDPEARIAALAPGESRAFVVRRRARRDAAIVAAGGMRVPIPCDVDPQPVPLIADVIVPEAVRAGGRLDVRLRCVAAGQLDVVRVRPRPSGGAVYVAGSTTVNGHAIVDGSGGPPLLLGEGLALYDIPPDVAAEIGWSLLPRTPGDLIVAVDLEVNGSRVEVPAAHVHVGAATPFGARPSSLPFHVDAATVGDPDRTREAAAPLPSLETTPTAAPRPEPFLLYLALDDERSAAIGRVLRGSRGAGIAGHLSAIGVLLPTAIGADATVASALESASAAVRGVYERLFVKLRIPGYDLTPFDLEDNAARRELLRFFDAAATGVASAPPEGAGLRVTLTSTAGAATRAALAAAPLGGTSTLTAIAALLPRAAEAPLGALGAYVDHLVAALADTCSLAHDDLAKHLVTQRSSALDAARDAAIEALEAAGTPVGA